MHKKLTISFIASLMDTLSTLEDQINNVTLNAERKEFELWKEKEELKLQSFAASKRWRIYLYYQTKIQMLR
jgi:hypothetical protein